MPKTVPNQRLVAIHRERAASDFLGIKNSSWQAAARDLGAQALMLYLYFVPLFFPPYVFGGHRLANISIDFWWCVLYHKVKKSLVNQRFSP